MSKWRTNRTTLSTVRLVLEWSLSTTGFAIFCNTNSQHFSTKPCPPQTVHGRHAIDGALKTIRNIRTRLVRHKSRTQKRVVGRTTCTNCCRLSKITIFDDAATTNETHQLHCTTSSMPDVALSAALVVQAHKRRTTQQSQRI